MKGLLRIGGFGALLGFGVERGFCRRCSLGIEPCFGFFGNCVG